MIVGGGAEMAGLFSGFRHEAKGIANAMRGSVANEQSRAGEVA